MKDIVLVGIGGLLGAISRFVTGRWLSAIFPMPGHMVTLVINASGSMLLGFIIAKAAGSSLVGRWQVFLAAGFCGSFTTFSSWVLDIANLMEQASLRTAASHAFVGVLVGVAALAVGVFLGRHWPVPFDPAHIVQALRAPWWAR